MFKDLIIMLLHAMKSREGKEMVSGFKSCYGGLNAKGHHPTMHVLDNKCSCTVKESISPERTTIHVVRSYTTE